MSYNLPPKARGLEPYNPPGTDLLVWEYEAGGRPYAIVFHRGNERLPVWHLAFSSPSARKRHIKETVKEQLKMASRVVERHLRCNLVNNV